jgi:hypothetical protein
MRNIKPRWQSRAGQLIGCDQEMTLLPLREMIESLKRLLLLGKTGKVV